MSDTWDKPLPGHASMSLNSVHGELRNKKIPIPTGMFKEVCPEKSLEPTWGTPWGLYMKGHGHHGQAMVMLPCTPPGLALSLEKMALSGGWKLTMHVSKSCSGAVVLDFPQ